MPDKTPLKCDWTADRKIKKTKLQKNKNRFYKHKGNLQWKNVKTEKYKTIGNEWANIIRKTLIGNHGESTKFHLRYFEIASGGNSSFEKHKHEHVVICVKGKGKAVTGKNIYKMNYLDVLYVSPNTPHQLSNPFKSPFGFLCIVNAKRDKPKIISNN